MTPLTPLHQLRGAIEKLSCTQLDIQKKELLSIVEAIAPTNGHHDGLHDRLSPRENEVMSMILEGRRLKEIAAKLDISVKTVTTHRSRLLRKLNIEDNLALYRYGVRNGLIHV